MGQLSDAIDAGDILMQLADAHEFGYCIIEQR